MTPIPRLFVALDVPDVAQARLLAARLRDLPCGLKIGHQLLYTGGEALVRELVAEGRPVFVDAKLLDIGETVAKATSAIAAMGAAFLTIHARRKALAAAVRGRGAHPLKLLAVTVLTDLDQDDLRGEGIDTPLGEVVVARARLAQAEESDGIICSPQEIAAVRAAVGGAMLIVTPGVRPLGAGADDQQRIATPTAAIEAGADALVVGRPIVSASDPITAAEAILAEIARARAPRPSS